MVTEFRQTLAQGFKLLPRGTGTEDPLTKLRKLLKDRPDLLRRLSLTKHSLRTSPAPLPVQIQPGEPQIRTFLILFHIVTAFFVFSARVLYNNRREKSTEKLEKNGKKA